MRRNGLTQELNEDPGSMTGRKKNTRDVAASTPVANPEFEILFTDDTTYSKDSDAERDQSSMVDPLCVIGVKVERQNSQVDSGSKGAVSVNVAVRSKTATDGILSGRRRASTSNNPQTQGVSASYQKLVTECSPILMDHVKSSCVGGLEDESHSRPAETMQMACLAKQTPVCTPPSSASLPVGGKTFNDPLPQVFDQVDLKDNLTGFQYSVASRNDTVDTALLPRTSSSVSSPAVRNQVMNPVSGKSSSSEIPKGALSEPRPLDNTPKHKCPICNTLFAGEKMPDHLKTHETLTDAQTRRPRRHCTVDPTPTFFCSTCTFVAESTTELSEHLELHESGEVGGTRITMPPSNRSRLNGSSYKTISRSDSTSRKSIGRNFEADSNSSVLSTEPAVNTVAGAMTVSRASRESDVSDMDDPEPFDDSAPRERQSSSENSSDHDSSDQENYGVIDPKYVPPSREKIPPKTALSVLQAIPAFEPFTPKDFNGGDADSDTPRPRNECLVCEETFETHELLKAHRELRFSKLRCCTCSVQAGDTAALQVHMNKHIRPKRYDCKECDKSFFHRGKYVLHFLAHRGDYHYKCELCGKGFNTYNDFEMHANRERNIRPYRCVKCNNSFYGRQGLRRHHRNQHNGKATTECKVCKKRINKIDLADHMKRHENVKKGGKNILCDQCGKVFKRRDRLTRHVKIKHSQERPYVCTYCGAAFKAPTNLKTHERKHTGERPYKCDVCEKTFAYQAPLMYHMRIHTGERPYKCEYCDRTFAQPSPFAVHKRLHTGERPYMCKVCPESFPSHAAVRNHMQTHANAGNSKGREISRGKGAGVEIDKPAVRPKKPRKRRSKVMDDSDDSEDDSETSPEGPAGPVQPSRRSGRQTKCTKSFAHEEDSGDYE